MTGDFVYEIKKHGTGFRVTNGFGTNYNDFYLEGPFHEKYVVLQKIRNISKVSVLTVLGNKGKALDFAYSRALKDAETRKEVRERVGKARGYDPEDIIIEDITGRAKQNKLEEVASS